MSSTKEALDKLSKSKFRSSFKLNQKDIEYINEIGLDKIKEHAVDFVNVKLKPDYPKNDTRQTPYHGHPVFKAMHACACCCRKCLNKWYNVNLGVELTDTQRDKIVNLLMEWINKELSI